MKNKIDIAKPCLDHRESKALREVVESGWLTQGPRVAAFEKAFAKRHQVKHAVAVSNCTTGLFLSLKAIGVGGGDEVIVPAFTWVATANAVMQCGATPVFVDIDPRTYNINPELLPQKITKKTKAIIPVHLFGLCADMDRLSELAGGLPLIEDSACAVGATYHGRSAGSLGKCGVFSFHPRKIITTGEGGMITTNDSGLAEKLNRLRNHGASVSEEQRHLGPKPYLLPEFAELGYNFRMTDLQGAVGGVQLNKLNKFLEERRHWADYYNQELAKIDWIITPSAAAGYQHSWQSYVCLVEESVAVLSCNALMELLLEQGIATRPGTHAVNRLSLYQKKGGGGPEDRLNQARLCNDTTIALPLHNCMLEIDYKRIVDIISKI